MKKAKLRFYGILLFTLIFVLFQSLEWIFIGDKSTAFWLGIAFNFIAFGIGIFVILFGALQKKVILSYPFYIVSFLYCLIQWAFSVLFDSLQINSFMIVSITFVVLLAVYGIFQLTNRLTSSFIESNDKTVLDCKKQLFEWQNILSDLMNRTNDVEVKTAVQELRDKVHYSDPIGNKHTSELEKNFAKDLKDLQTSFESQSKDNNLLGLANLVRSLETRNTILKQSK
jgi:ABC-type transport system involved in multi-copper enzyme maturation permease subunit